MATQGEHEVLVISVQKHKTDIQRPVNVTCQGKFSGHTTTKYALSVTPEYQCNYFLVVQGGRQVMNPNYYIIKRGHKYKLDVPTATRVRKIGSTATVKVCSATEATLLATHMGNIQPTQQK